MTDDALTDAEDWQMRCAVLWQDCEVLKAKCERLEAALAALREAGRISREEYEAAVAIPPVK